MPSFFLGLFLLGDVAGDGGCADDFSIAVLDGGDGRGNGDGLAVLAKAFGLIKTDRLAAPDARHNVEQFVAPVKRKQKRDGASDDFLGGVAVNALGGGIPTDDDAVEGFPVNGFVAGFDNRG